MESEKSVLPVSFFELEPLAHWALATEQERMTARESSTWEELQTFYGAMMPRMTAIIEYLNRFPLNDMPADARRLLLMALSVVEVSIATELYRQPKSFNAFDRARIEIGENL
ncbi:MAG TPA: hypothetical protein VMB26_12505 [Candidatus Binataceae bacterium]|nr:hypothetical protein [Candidatus Binataceae bacterium]